MPDKSRTPVIVGAARTPIGKFLGGLAEGVLGCEDDSGVTLVQGWNWYTGAAPSAIGPTQYDFGTIVTHELGHALVVTHR